jgi:hypothetical protein
MDKTIFVMAFFIAALFAGLFLKYAPSNPNPATKETFMQQEVGKPLNSKGMGPYDQMGGGIDGWGSSEAMPVSQSPANNPLDTNKIMSLVGNTVSSDCCPSTFNTDTGCVCLTEADRRLFASRGGNKA